MVKERFKSIKIETIFIQNMVKYIHNMMINNMQISAIY